MFCPFFPQLFSLLLERPGLQSKIDSVIAAVEIALI